MHQRRGAGDHHAGAQQRAVGPAITLLKNSMDTNLGARLADEFGNSVFQTTSTNGSGQYSFTGLNPSSAAGYTVTETPPATDTHLGQTSTTGGAVATTSGVVSNIVLTTGSSRPT